MHNITILTENYYFAADSVTYISLLIPVK